MSEMREFQFALPSPAIHLQNGRTNRNVPGNIKKKQKIDGSQPSAGNRSRNRAEAAGP